jgi:sulfate adenylyltransferase subunit 1
VKQLRIVVAGNTGCGRKTLIGQLLRKTVDKTNQSQAIDCERKPALVSEQPARDDITDIPQFKLDTLERSYHFIIPQDHTDFLKNAATGAITAGAAILVIDASEGIYKQIFRYAYLLTMLGIKQTIVVVNKMDMKRYNRIKFWQLSEEISDFLKKLDVQIVDIIPVSAKCDDNIITASSKMDWDTSATLMESLDHFSAPKDLTQLPLRVIMQSCYLTDGKTTILAKVASGKLFSGHQLTIGPVHHITKVLSIEEISGQQKNYADPGELVALVLEDTDYVSRGQVGFNVCHPPLITDLLIAELFWIGGRSLKPKDRVNISCGSDCCSGRIEKISDIRDPSCLNVKFNHVEQLAQSQIADVRIKLDSPICIDPFGELQDLGRFTIFQDNKITGGGIFK